MRVIPVIDVRHGQVVRAVAGERANYQPIVSPLFVGSSPQAAVAGLMALARFPVIYVADLDGIEGRGANCGLIRDIVRSHPGVEVWADRGARTAHEVAGILAVEQACAVIGSETGVSAGEVAALKAQYGERIILSLDFRADGFVGEPGVLADAACWPDRVIVMTLAKVGAGMGPDLVRIKEIAARRPGAAVYAAGGVRNATDLAAAYEAGACGALVSSALHSKNITAGDLD